MQPNFAISIHCFAHPSPIAHRLLILLVLLAALLPGLSPQPAYAQDAPPIVYQYFNSDLTLAQDGTLHVRMVQQLRFDDSFSTAFFDIPTRYTTDIDNIRVYVAADDVDNANVVDPELEEVAPTISFATEEYITVEWSYPTTQPGDVRLFVIEYDAHDVLWVYPDAATLNWQAVNGERGGLPVENSVVRVTLPPAIDPATVHASTNLGAVQQQTISQTLFFTASAPIPDGVPFIVTTAFPHGSLPVTVQAWQRTADMQDISLSIDRFHANLTINADGTLMLEELTDISVQRGALSQGYRALQLRYLDDIEAISVSLNNTPLTRSDSPCPGCYLVQRDSRPADWVYYDDEAQQVIIQEDDSGEVAIDWVAAEPIFSGETAQLAVAYQVDDALRVNAENQLLTWQVVPDYGQRVNAATLRITLPPGVSAEDVTVAGVPGQGAPRMEGNNSLFYTFDGPVVPGAWEIALTLPPNATTATPSLWQQELEAAFAEADADAVARARRTLIFNTLGIVAVVAAILFAIIAWFRWGRRRLRETLGGYVSEPPAPLSPAVAAYLVERKAGEQAILGAIFHLASAGLLAIDLENGIRLRRLRQAALQRPTRIKANGVDYPIANHLVALFDKVLMPGLPTDSWVTLDSLASLLRAHLPEVYALLARDVQPYFIGLPSSGWRINTGNGMLWLIVTLALVGAILLEWIGIITAFVIGFVLFLLLVVTAQAQGGSSYSTPGAQEAERWRRFKTYLANIKKYGDVAAAQAILDRYFGYAVAFGLEQVVVAQAESLGAGRPMWMPSFDQSTPDQPRVERRDIVSSRRGQTQPGQNVRLPRLPDLPDRANRPTLAGMSERLGSSLRAASRDLGNLLQTAAGDGDSAGHSVVFNSQSGDHAMKWQPGTPVSKVMDDILRQSVADARQINAREQQRREAEYASRAASRSSRSDDGGSSNRSRSSSNSRSSGGFGSSSSSRSSSRSSSSSSRSSSSPSRSSSSSSRSGGGGRSGFR